MRALTMVCITEELKRTHTTVADVYLGCDVPLWKNKPSLTITTKTDGCSTSTKMLPIP